MDKRLADIVFKYILLVSAVLGVLMIAFIFIFILSKAWGVLQASGLSFITETGFSEHIRDSYYLTPEEQTWRFGAMGLFVATLLTTAGALLTAVPIGIGTAVVICEFSHGTIGKVISTVIRLLACIPSIIYGLIGLMVVVPFIQGSFISYELQIQYLYDPVMRMQLSGKSLLAGIVVLGIMIMPIITALTVDAIKAVPKSYKEAGLGLGISHWRVISKIILPAAKLGIFAGVILAAGRGIGEAIALSMVSGGISNVPQVSHGGVFFLTPVLTLASAIINKSEAMSVDAIQSALFACGFVLILTSMFFSLSTRLVQRAVRGK
jgi:phosphate transport system permease protein